ncbi:hypothetical protein PACTADRAFT_47535 [Pachysolen tannophilus NRRL Y-2460]|uniref:Vacuolar protein sorting-associated protein 27 n=1 Tax=Pachysolen tannophilus NRRL Y-2460 TaxID=669874 RepID=A0A1E4U0Z4_PACTA|nr:hypothetical protein PACTADRAFT_47535 [Pachysolen tannophilus NRRL Y-2460]
MSWFNSSSSIQIDENVVEATSESIPNGEVDLAKCLEISDLIRSKQVLPRDAMRSLKKRLLNTKNPNVQKSCLKLIDFCIKNGGEHFVVEISSKEFLDSIVLMLHNKNLNDEVKNIILEFIQNWSLLFSKNQKLIYVTTIYESLSREGFKFPSVYNAEFNENFIESKVAPEWLDSDACMICSNLFTLINRKHHCRSCGGVFCGQHSSKSCTLPELGITIPVRVCDNCYDQHKSKKDKRKHHSSKHSHNTNTTSFNKNDEEMDDDLKKAIELSLKESAKYTPSAPTSAALPMRSSNAEGEEDEEMKRAIEASLKDFQAPQDAPKVVHDEEDSPYANFFPKTSNDNNNNNVNSSRHPSNVFVGQAPSASFSNPSSTKLPAQMMDLPGLNIAEEENIHLFSNLVDRIKTQPPGTIYQDQQLQTLHNNLTTLRPKLNKALADSITKNDKFVDMHSKIGTIMRLYDSLLEARLAHIYEKHTVSDKGYSNNFGYQQQDQEQQQQLQPQQAPYGDERSYYPSYDSETRLPPRQQYNSINSQQNGQLQTSFQDQISQVQHPVEYLEQSSPYQVSEPLPQQRQQQQQQEQQQQNQISSPYQEQPEFAPQFNQVSSYPPNSEELSAPLQQQAPAMYSPRPTISHSVQEPPMSQQQLEIPAAVPINKGNSIEPLSSYSSPKTSYNSPVQHQFQGSYPLMPSEPDYNLPEQQHLQLEPQQSLHPQQPSYPPVSPSGPREQKFTFPAAPTHTLNQYDQQSHQENNSVASIEETKKEEAPLIDL